MDRRHDKDVKYATPKSSFDKDYPDGGSFGKFKTRGPHHDQSIRVACDYTVDARDPVTGQDVKVTFFRVPQDRDIGLFQSMTTMGDYNTDRDTYSKVLACEGIDYKTKQHVSSRGDLSTVSEPVGSHSFNATKIPALAERLKHFEATGETGNNAIFDARENADLLRLRAGAGK